MRIAILESIVMPAGHEVEFDRILVEELTKQEHNPCFFVPEQFPFKLDYGVPVEYLAGGEAISYEGVRGVKKVWLAVKREQRRIKWYDEAFSKSEQGLIDEIIIPTASWRVFRSLIKSKLKNSPVPVVIILHGIMPKDRDDLLKGVKLCEPFANIHIMALGLQTENDFSELKQFKNFHVLLAPVYKPFDLPLEASFQIHEPLKLGFFGQYRKEKNLEFFLQAFQKARFNRRVELLIQGATVTESDGNDFERLLRLYADNKSMKFLHKNLLGIEWQRAVMDVDIMLLPYAAERYRYQPSAMLFTAIGYYKPVLQSSEINPEILQEFKIGEAVRLDSMETFVCQLENFINSFDEMKLTYEHSLCLANIKYGQEQLIRKIVSLLRQ